MLAIVPVPVTFLHKVASILIIPSKKKYTNLIKFIFCHCLLSRIDFSFWPVGLLRILLMNYCSLWTSLILCQQVRICQRRRLHLPLQLLWKYLLSIKQLKASDLQSTCSYSVLCGPELVSWHCCHFFSICWSCMYCLIWTNLPESTHKGLALLGFFLLQIKFLKMIMLELHILLKPQARSQLVLAKALPTSRYFGPVTLHYISQE